MKIIYNKVFLSHDTGSGHPENRTRLECFGELPETIIETGEPYLNLVHSRSYIETVIEACKTSKALDSDTQTSPSSFKAASYAAGAAIMASKTNDFAIVRPPGHHAHPGHSGGFCLFNNVAIAVQKLVESGKRVLILDFDGHLGDGTLETFFRTDKVLFCSLHQYPAYPGGGFADIIGEGAGRGFSVNIPLPPGSADDIYWNALQLFMPVAEQFKSDIVALSAGFDAFHLDPLLQLNLSAGMYYRIGKLVSEKFSNVFAVLEGGYNTDYLPKCVHNFLAGKNNQAIFYDDLPTSSLKQVWAEYESRMAILRKCLSPYWKMA